MNDHLRSLANSHSTFDGQVVFYLLPFYLLESEIVKEELGRIVPQQLWTNTKTGKQQTTPPIKPLLDSGEWQLKDLWLITHHTFTMCIPLTVHIEFNFTDETPAELKALKVFWENRTGDIQTDWNLFRQCIGVLVSNAWWEAHNATREKEMLSKAPEVQGADPKAGRTTNNASANTSRKSRSRKPKLKPEGS